MLWILDPHGNRLCFDAVTRFAMEEGDTLVVRVCTEELRYTGTNATRMMDALVKALDQYHNVILA